MLCVLGADEEEALDYKVLQKEMRADNWTMLCFGVAKELGMTVRRLLEEATEEELILWSAYFGILNEDQDRALKKAKGRR